MKTSLTLFISSALLLTTPLHAVQETPDEIILTGDFTNDGHADLIIVQRSTGSFRVGSGDAAGALTWAGSRDSGVPDVSAALLENMTLTSGMELLITNETLNDGVALTHGNEDWTKAMLKGAGHTLLAPGLPNPFGGTTAAIIGTQASPARGIGLGGDPPTPNRVYHQNLSSTFGFEPDGPTFPGVPRHGEKIIGSAAGHQIMWKEIDPANPLSSSLRVVTAANGGFGIEITSAVVATLGGTSPDFVVAPSSPGSTGQWVFFWNRGTTTLKFRHLLTDPDTTFTSQLSFTQPQAIDVVSLITRPAATPLVAVSLDQGASVRIYEFDGTNLTLKQSLTPEGGRNASGLVPWGNADGFAMLTRTGTSGPTTHVTRYSPDGSGNYQPIGTDALSTVNLKPAANVFTWSGEPMVDPSTRLMSRRRAGDWTSAVTNFMGPTVNATTETFVSTSSGLANPTTVGAGNLPSGAMYVSGNQTSSVMSVFTDEGPAIAPALNLEISPPPGRYDTTSLKVTISVKGSFGIVQGYYKIGNGAWIFMLEGLSGNQSFSFDLTESATIQSFAEYNTGFGPAFKTAMESAAYTLGTRPAVTPRTTLDANGNGIGDEWERLFNINDPTADDDSDGQSNFAEFNAGTDPRDATNFYTTPPTLPELSIGVEPDGSGGNCICARWSATDPSVRVESSPTLGLGAVWTPVNFGTVRTSGLTRIFSTVPSPGENARFFRLARY